LTETLALIGIGLIGSSIAHGARSNALARTVVAYDADASVRDKVRSLNLVDHVANTPGEAVQNADLVILCVPVGASAAVSKDIAPFLKAGAIVSDVGSVKGSVIKAVQPLLPKAVHFVPAHPVAGTEYSGPESGFATLFKNRWCILTPLEDGSPDATHTVQRFWEGLGARIQIMTAQHHDLVLAITSHVPHLIAYNIVGTADDLATVTQSEVIQFSAGGFRDFTRIAASDPTMWRDVFLHNKEAVLEMLGRFNEDLAALARAIRWDDGDALHALFTRTRAIRRSIVAEGQDQ
jgi:cyclohexadieny/prephenate dehydrogenase